MRNWVKGLLLTAAAWVLLVAMYAVIELIMGRAPFGAFHSFGPSARFITFTVALVLILGALLGYASDVVRAREGRHGR
jgi:hypothetical protein